MNYTKITSADTQGKGVVGLPDTPNLTVGEIQAKFEELTNDVVIPKFNNLVDELDANVGRAIQSPEITDIRISADNTLQISKDGGQTYADTASSGHTIMNGSGIEFAQRTKLQFSDNVVISDDVANERTFISVPPGEKGDKGDTATVSVGSVQSGAIAEVINSGSNTDAILNFTLPKGDDGAAATIQVGTVTSGANASVSNRGTSSQAIFDFILPKGEKGDVGQGINILGDYDSLAALQSAHPTGNPGNAYMVGATAPKDLYIWDAATRSWKNEGALQGVKGEKGDAATVTVGTVTEGSTFAVTNSGTTTDAVLNFTLKKGDKGDPGNSGTIAVGTVTSGTTASVTNRGTNTAAVFDFVVPKGDKGDQGNPTVLNGKTGASITLYGKDITVNGYKKATTASAVSANDTINAAIGKVEKMADDNASSISSINTSITQINSNFIVNEFVFTTDMWAEDSAHTYADYPYVATYVTNKYSDDYVPLNITPLPMNGAVYTEEEFSAFASTNLSCADLGTHGFRVWIKEVPEVSIKFRIMGEG